MSWSIILLHYMYTSYIVTHKTRILLRTERFLSVRRGYQSMVAYCLHRPRNSWYLRIMNNADRDNTVARRRRQVAFGRAQPRDPDDCRRRGNHRPCFAQVARHLRIYEQV